jgi:hypothetical protein
MLKMYGESTQPLVTITHAGFAGNGDDESRAGPRAGHTRGRLNPDRALAAI